MNATISRIEKYFNGTSSYPLMVVVHPDEYLEVLSAFSSVQKVRVSDYCVGADKEPDIRKLQEDVKTLSGKFLLVGLGDYLANKTEAARQTLSPYKDLELMTNSHIAILLSAHMFPYVKGIHDADPRVRARIVLPKTAPIIDTVNNSALVYGIKAYLAACEKGENVGNVKTSRNIQNVNVINPENAYDELKHKYPHEFGKLSRSVGTDNNWGELLESLNRKKKALRQYLASMDFEPLDYTFIDYAKKRDYIAWLYFVNLKLNSNITQYLGFVASKTDTLEQLFYTAKVALLDIDISDNLFKKYYSQRKTILKTCADVDMADFINKIVTRGSDRISYLTDNTRAEKQAVILSLCEGANDLYLKDVYPELYFYLQDFIFDDERFTQYFSAYKKSKVRNELVNVLPSLVAEYAISRPYNSLPARSSLFVNLDDGDTLLLFLDAMGVEFLGYINEMCNEMRLRLSVRVARGELPSITSPENKAFFNEWRGRKETPIKDLDDLKHNPERGYDYDNSPYPIHLADELDVIKTALERAKIKLLTEYKKVVIASDHGASRLAAINSVAKIPNNGCEPKSNGRYCVGENLPTGANIITDIENKYAVIADYSRFEGSRIASVEVHGGATMEEVVVPIIELSLYDGSVEVTLENDVIEISYNTVPTLILIIIPDNDNVVVSINNKPYTIKKFERSKYKVVMHDLKKGQYTLDVFDGLMKIASKEFTIKSKGFVERDIL